MKKFIINSTIFVLPFIVFFVLNTIFFNPREGDLVRLGYLYSNPSPKSRLIHQYSLPRKYRLLSELDLTADRKFKVITIGDSFSEQGNFGYQNFLANKGVSVLHIDRFLSGDNPIQTLVRLLKSNIFETIRTEYIILQSVEREFNQRNENIDFDVSTDIYSISNEIEKHNEVLVNFKLEFFSDVMVKAPLINIQYFFYPKPFFSKTYKYETNSNELFSNVSGDILFYQDDIDLLKVKNDSQNIFNSINMLEIVNNLAEQRGIKLIVLVSPDKYDLYYNFIENKKNLPKPLFFSIYEKAEKKYKHIDSYELLSEKIQNEKDIYFYDDTHWSPKASKFIAERIYSIINEQV